MSHIHAQALPPHHLREQKYYFGQLWDGENGDANELLESGAVSPDEENVIAFEIIENADNPLETLVKVTDIY